MSHTVPHRVLVYQPGARQPEKVSIIRRTASPSGYSTGDVQPVARYSATLARHSSGVPQAVGDVELSHGLSTFS